jgi:Pyruvate/2-oxoacid:ferredoxin oxidoreductase gamma subunit
MTLWRTTNILIVGVGGQGNRTLMNIIAHAMLAAGEDVRILSSTSLGRLGGPITCHIRIGPAVSATIPTGEADILVALEMNEALRVLPMMRRGALAFIYTYRRLPIIAGINGMRYPSVDEIERASAARDVTSIFVPELLSSLTDTDLRGIPITSYPNSIMLGVLCGYTGLFPCSFVEQSLCQCIPECAEQNCRALAIGWRYGERLQG